MEFTPEISAALDIYAEECTTPSEKGYMLSIFSESSRIKSILGDLFNNTLDINTNLPMWIRNVCKYGDNFVYLKIDPENGIIGCNQLPNIEIERTEGDVYVNQQNAPTDDKKSKVELRAEISETLQKEVDESLEELAQWEMDK